MLDSKLVDSIKLLSPAEQAEFDSFLDSRFFQKEFSVQQLKQLLALILEAIFSPKTTELTKEFVHKELFAPKEFAENRIDRIMYELNRLVKTFSLVKHYLRPENEVMQMLNWSELCRSNGGVWNYEKQFQKLRRGLEQKNHISPETYFDLYLIAKEEHEWESTFNKAKGDLGLPKAIDSLDHYYYSQKLEMLNRFLLQQRIASINIPANIQASIDSFVVPEYYLSRNLALQITNKIHNLLKEQHPKTEGFQELFVLLKACGTDLHPKLLVQFYSYLRNLCAFMIDAGNSELNGLLHEIQQDNLSRGHFYHEGKITPNAMLSIAQQAIRANNVAWAIKFVHDHKDKIIDENETHDFYRMNLALCYFAEQKYEDVLDTIPFGSTYSYYHLMARRLELKAYYELGSEILPSKIDAFKMFINRTGNKSLSKPLAEMLTNFGNFVHQLSLSIPGDKKRSELLIKRIKAKKLVGERNWLLEKAEQLGNARL